MSTYIFLQHYWWILISLLRGLLVFLLFVQGGQTLLYTIAKTEDERNLLVNSLGRKWEFTFTHWSYSEVHFLPVFRSIQPVSGELTSLGWSYCSVS